MRWTAWTVSLGLAGAAWAEDSRGVWLEAEDGGRIRIATLHDTGQTYRVEMARAPFVDHFLSMRPFKRLEGPQTHWCHVPYPYDQVCISPEVDPTDLKYEFLFLWKGATEYGINMWNGVYYKLEKADQGWVGMLHEMNMDLLSAPPPVGMTHPFDTANLEPGDPARFWLPRLVIE
ncbi:hypothetical protein [Actibacterium sp. 188UL27-1]|uniref:hypothetical protein n=1 Tax=Actibacterium sp. 188UL27-1 TaxID=2786961 RepID=UPI00195A83AF|nr:hypothetical protein [Actibacterium sp. 188UL27-1]MBM7066403.1 hypothetical protein [Actibacterium sp. 188UL27-1]